MRKLVEQAGVAPPSLVANLIAWRALFKVRDPALPGMLCPGRSRRRFIACDRVTAFLVRVAGDRLNVADSLVQRLVNET